MCIVCLSLYVCVCVLHRHTSVCKQAQKMKETPEKDKDGLSSVFGQIYTQLKAVKYETWRQPANTQMFNISFLVRHYFVSS